MSIAGYLSVREFAERVDVTRQSIYNWLSSLDKDTYNEITIENNGRKISESAVGRARDYFDKSQNEPDKNSDSGSDAKRNLYDSNGDMFKAQTETIDALNKIILRQEEELKNREEQIAEKDKQIAEYAVKFADIAQGALQTSVQAQMLHAVSESARLQNDAQNAAESVTENNVEPKKRTLWEIIIGKRKG